MRNIRSYSSLLNRISWALFKKEVVGMDAKGNKYYRQLDKTIDGATFERRLVKYAGDWEPSQVPPEWLQWLKKVRQDPPTSIELEKGQVDRDNFKKMAEKHDAEAAEAALRWQQTKADSAQSSKQDNISQQVKES